MSVLETTFKLFAINFQEREKYSLFDEESALKLAKKVPDELLNLMKEEELFTFENGMFFLVNPLEYRLINQDWKLDIDECYIFLRTAFGDLFYWDGHSIKIIHVNSAVSNSLSSNMAKFFNFSLPDKRYNQGTLFGRFLKKAKTNLGKLAPDECYGFVPALPLGGKESANSLQKVKINEYLSLLAHLHQ